MKPETVTFKSEEAVSFLKANRKMLSFWGMAIVLVIATWAFFMRKSPSPASADENTQQTPAAAVAAAPTQGPSIPAVNLTPPVTITPISPKSNISITSSVTRNTGGPQDEYQYMAKLNNLAGDNLAKFDRACAEREIAINAWTAGPGKQVDDVRAAMKAAKAAKDEAAVANLQAKYDLLNQMDIDYRTMLRSNVMQTLTLEQQRRWAGFVINQQVMKKFSKIELSDRQKESIQRMADDAADRTVKADTLEKDPFLNSLKSNEVIDPIVTKVRDRVLTIEQRMRVPQTGKNGAVILTR
jgi:hypothetical protein